MGQQLTTADIQRERGFQDFLPHTVELHLGTEFGPSSFYFLDVSAVGATYYAPQLIHCLKQHCAQLFNS